MDNMKKIKAALYTAGNQDELVNKAIRAYREEEKHTNLMDVHLNIGDKKVLVKQVPGFSGDNEEKLGNLHLLAALEDVLSQWSQLPDTITFEEILTH